MNSALLASTLVVPLAAEQRPFGVGLGQERERVANVSSPLTPLSTDESRLDLGELEAEKGPYHPDLAEVLLEAANLALLAARYEEADELFSRALRNKRINEGLYSAGQLQIVQTLAEVARFQGDPEALKARIDYYYRIQGSREVGLTATKLQAANQWLMARIELLTIQDWGGKERDALTLYDQASALVKQACTPSSEAPADADIREWCKPLSLRLLSLGYLIQWHVEPFVQDAYGDPFQTRSQYPREADRDLISDRLETIEPTIERRLRGVLEQALQVSANDPELTLALADWNWFHNRRSAALSAYKDLVKAHGDWFSSPKPLPQEPRLMLDTRLADEAINVQIRCDVSARGRASNIVIESVELESSPTFQARRHFKQIIFRPKINQLGEPSDSYYEEKLVLYR